VTQVDHVVWGVHGLDAAAATVLERYGLASVPGGRHPGWGTANRIIPLGESYLELLAVVDPDEAAADPVGRGLAALLSRGEGLLLVCLRTDDLDDIAARLELPVDAKSRLLPDGTRIGWRTAGLAAALANPSLPFFIEWAVAPDRHPGRMVADHSVVDPALVSVTVGASPAELETWLGGEVVPLRCAGRPGVNEVTLSTATGELQIPRTGLPPRGLST